MSRWLLLPLIGLAANSAWASKPSYTVAHPIGWMHSLPTGETPGWGTKTWINFEFNYANIWNNQFDLTHRTSGITLSYGADYEQSSVVADLGMAIGDQWAIGLVAPFASRGGGVLDDFIDQFHSFIGSERFLRHVNDGFARSFEVKTSGQSEFEKKNWSAVGNLKFKAKYWAWRKKGSANGSCDCGLALSGQVKFPLTKGRDGMSSGTRDYSLLAHFGLPIGKHSGVWTTAAFTQLGKNAMFEDWPMRRYAQMYELTFDLAFSERWGVILQARTESPLFNKNELSYHYTTTDPIEQKAYRVASGWNSLVYWRTTQAAGFRWRSSSGQQINFLILEDWGLGNPDSRKDHLYVNNAPDVAFITQLWLRF